MKFAFIETMKAEFPVTVLCRVLGVSKSGFYAYRQRPASDRAREDLRLRVLCKEAHVRSRGIYGSPRIHRTLKNKGIAIGRKRVIRLMHLEGIAGKRRRRWTKTTDSKHCGPVAENILNRELTAKAPNERWAGDVTYLRTPAGFMYLAVLIDLYSRMVVGWAISPLNDRHLALNALTMALTTRRPSAGLLHHTDQGSPYASEDYQQALDDNRLVCSMSRKGNCYDNAAVESFFGTLKTELKEDFDDPGDVERELFDYIEVFYNRARLHSAIGYLSPADYERGILTTKAA